MASISFNRRARHAHAYPPSFIIIMKEKTLSEKRQGFVTDGKGYYEEADVREAIKKLKALTDAEYHDWDDDLNEIFGDELTN